MEFLRDEQRRVIEALEQFLSTVPTMDPDLEHSLERDAGACPICGSSDCGTFVCILCGETRGWCQSVSDSSECDECWNAVRQVQKILKNQGRVDV